jgi:hypothetical protein
MHSIQPLLKSVGWKAETVEDWSKRSQEGKIKYVESLWHANILILRNYLDEISSLSESTLGLG